ncbi:hypothetical protein MRX96_032697 [Rhipicephalus microplus]
MQSPVSLRSSKAPAGLNATLRLGSHEGGDVAGSRFAGRQSSSLATALRIHKGHHSPARTRRRDGRTSHHWAYQWRPSLCYANRHRRKRTQLT